MAAGTTIFSDFLSALDVPHTRKYSDRRFNSLTFKSLFGLSRLLEEYGVDNAAWKVPVADSIYKVPLPCLAQKPGNFVIVTKASPESVGYIYKGERKEIPTKDFEQKWTGVILTAIPDAASREPDYERHRMLDFAAAALNWILPIAALAVLVYLYVTRVFYHSIGASALIIVDIAGLTVTSMLMLKSLNVHTAAADRVCGILQRGGCDKILATDASKFFGLFGWSEVGLGYFTVSTATLLLFPGYIHYLALANLFCLPFTVWSIWYQKFKAHHWCTLCVITQTLLWCQFFCYMGGGFENSFRIDRPEPWILLCCYVAAVLSLNRIADMLTKNRNN